MGAPAPVKYHYSYCFFTYSVERGWTLVQLLVFKVPRGPTRAEDIVRWGVWLGRHIC